VSALVKVVGGRIVPVLALVGVLLLAGCAGGLTTTAGNATATPAFSPAAGTYTSSQTVTISDASAGAVLYCTTDGTTPTTSSPQCSQPTTVFKSEFLQAIAVAPGSAPSAAAAAGYTIDLSAAATPTFSPAGGSYATAQTVTIRDTSAGATIYYTADGSVPTSSSTLYVGPVAVAKGETLSAIAIVAGFNNSGVASAAYTIGTGGAVSTATPQISPASGAYTVGQAVTITDATPGAAIYYTTDGSTPSTSSTAYTTSLILSQGETINAIAVAGGSTSAQATATYTISGGGTSGGGSGPGTGGGGTTVVPPPTFSPGTGTNFTSVPQSVEISDTVSGLTGTPEIYFILVPGTTPSSTTPSASSTNGRSVSVTQTSTISAVAILNGVASSPAIATYTVQLGTAALPTFSVGTGTYASTQTETISDSTPGATIYYTTDGSAPLNADGSKGATANQYSGSLTVSSTTTINAAAVATNYTSSLAATAAITITPGAVTVNGTVLSGTTPVSGAQVQLLQAGVTTLASGQLPGSVYGTGSQLVTGTGVVTTDSSGAFSIGVACPAAPNDQLYLVATGGSAGGGTNPSLELMSALGSCGNLSSNTQFVVNEVTTVASAYALSPFMTTAPMVGTSAGNAVGLDNAFLTVTDNLVTAAGVANSFTPAYPGTGANDPNLVNNSTVPQARINTLANLLNACVSSNGASSTGCNALFTAATPPSGTTPSNTLQAILDIAQNPGNNAAALFPLAASGPFTPALSAAPNDWTLALTFTGAGLGIKQGGAADFIANTALAIDAGGNIWVTGLSPQGAPNSNMLAEFSNLGAPLTPPTVVNGGTFAPVSCSTAPPGDGCYGGYPSPAGQPAAIAIDPSGNGWIAGQAASTCVNEVTPTSVPGSFTLPLTPDFMGLVSCADVLGGSPNLALAIDSLSNVWAGGNTADATFAAPLDETSAVDINGGTGVTGVEEGLFLSGDDPNVPFDPNNFDVIGWNGVTNVANFGEGGPSTNAEGGHVFGQLQQLILDSNGNLWSEEATTGNLSQIDNNPADSQGQPPAMGNPATGTEGTIVFAPYFTGSAIQASVSPVVADGAGNVYVCGSGSGQSLDVFHSSGFYQTGGATAQPAGSFPIATGRGCGSQMALDGAGHIFAVTGVTAPGIVDEFTTNGTMISPAPVTGATPSPGGYTGTSSGETPVINPDPFLVSGASSSIPAGLLQTVAGAAIDSSGNLWVLNGDTGESGSAGGNVLVKFVGIAAPVVTPISLAQANAQMGARP
jgi:Chitobiase/beta-hexosaminidase C-terminal domain